MEHMSSRWLPPEPPRGGTEIARLESRIDELVTALRMPAGQAYPDQTPAGVTAYLRALKSYAFPLIALALTLAAAGWMLAQREQKIYRARSTVEMLEPGRVLNVRSLSNSSPMFGGDTYVETQVAKLESTSLLKAVRARLIREGAFQSLASMPAAAAAGPSSQAAIEDADIRALKQNLEISPIRGTSLIQVTFEAPNPTLAARLVNTLTDEYIQSDADARAQNSEQTRAWLEKELDDAKSKLENSEAKLQQYANSSGLLFTSPKGNVAEESQDKLQFIAQELSQAQAKRANLQARYEIALAKSPDADVSPDDSEVLHNIQTRLIDLKRQRASLAAQFTPDYYKCKQADAEIAALEASRDKEYARWLTKLRNEYETEQRHEKLVAYSYRQQASVVSDQAAKSIHYNVLNREVETNRNLYDSLLNGMKEAGVNAAARVRNARVVDAATAPFFPYRPNPARNAAIGLLTGLIAGIGFVLVKQTGDRRLKHPGAAVNCLNVPELGVIPSVKPHLLPTARRNMTPRRGWSSPRLAFLDNASKAGPVADAFHSVVTSIFFSGRHHEPPRVVVVTSAMAHEGKSTVTGNLGLMAAQIGKRVLLIDGDLRNPRLHQTYSISNLEGLSNLLMEQTPLEDGKALGMVQATSVDRLWVLPGGSRNSNPLPLLHSERMAEIVQQFRDEFDLILIDTPPVLRFADARLFGRLSDAVVLVVRSGHTSRSVAMAAKSRFTDDGLPVIGTVLNDWNGKESGYEYSEGAYRT